MVSYVVSSKTCMTSMPILAVPFLSKVNVIDEQKFINRPSRLKLLPWRWKCKHSKILCYSFLTETTLESMIHNQLYYLAGPRGWLYPKQAGFRISRSCEAQIRRVTQTTSDSYQATKPKRTVMALPDFPKGRV